MADFNYIVRTESGTRKTGSITANNYNEAIEKLQSDNLVVIKLTERDTSFDFFKPFLERLALEFDKFKNKVPLAVLVFFYKTITNYVFFRTNN